MAKLKLIFGLCLFIALFFLEIELFPLKILLGIIAFSFIISGIKQISQKYDEDYDDYGISFFKLGNTYIRIK